MKMQIILEATDLYDILNEFAKKQGFNLITYHIENNQEYIRDDNDIVTFKYLVMQVSKDEKV